MGEEVDLEMISEENFTDNDITDELITSQNSFNRRNTKPRQQFSPETDVIKTKQTKKHKRPAAAMNNVSHSIPPPTVIRQIEQQILVDVQSQSQVARQVRRIASRNFRLPESVYDGLNLPNQYTHLLPLPNNSQKPITQRRELHIPLDADIDDFASTQDDLYAQKDEDSRKNGFSISRLPYNDRVDLQWIIRSESNGDEYEEAQTSIKNLLPVNSNSMQLVEKPTYTISKRNLNEAKLIEPRSQSSEGKKAKKMPEESSNIATKRQPIQNKAKLNLNKLLKRKSSPPDKRSRLADVTDAVSQNTLISEKDEDPSANLIAENSHNQLIDNSKRQPKPRIFTDEYYYPSKTTLKKPETTEKKETAKKKIISKPQVKQKRSSILLASYKSKIVGKKRIGSAPKLNKPKVQPTQNQIPFEFDSSGMLKSTAELLRSIKARMPTSLTPDTSKQFFSSPSICELPMDTEPPPAQCDAKMVSIGSITPIETISSKRSGRAIIPPKPKDGYFDFYSSQTTRQKKSREMGQKQEGKQHVPEPTSGAPTPMVKKKTVSKNLKPLTLSLDAHSTSDSLMAESLPHSTQSTATSEAPISTPKYTDFNSKYPIYAFDPSLEIKQNKVLENISRRKNYNRFANGLEISDDVKITSADYFYKEILMRKPFNLDIIDEFVDPLTIEASTSSDEFMHSNSADLCASEIAKHINKNKTSLIEYDPELSVTELLESELSKESKEVHHYVSTSLKFILKQRLLNMSTLNIDGGASLYYVTSIKNAYKFKNSLKIYCKNDLIPLAKSHRWLLENLPVELISAYITILRFIKTTSSELCDDLMNYCNDSRFIEVNNCLKGFLQPRVMEPPLLSTQKLLEFDSIANVSLVLVYPYVSSKFYQRSSKSAHESIFRNLLPRIACCVEKVELSLDIEENATIEEITWKSIHLIRKRVSEIVKRRPNDHIFLAGWGVSCLLNQRVISRVSGVSGLLNFAFPTESPLGSRGDVEDELCLTYCPVLFVVGENGTNVRIKSIQTLRKNMIGDSGLIMIGSANHNLFVSTSRLAIERITQKCVERTLIKYVIAFIRQVINDLGPPKDSRDSLKPVKLPNIFEVDITAVKGTSGDKPRSSISSSTLPSTSKPHTKSAMISETTSGTHQQNQSHQSRTSSGIGNLTTSYPQPIPMAPPTRTTPVKVQSARSSLSNSLKRASDHIGSTELRIPAPSILSQQLPPLPPIQGYNQGTTITDANERDSALAEEEEAAAALLQIEI